jgi:hypothetical protein
LVDVKLIINKLMDGYHGWRWNFTNWTHMWRDF